MPTESVETLIVGGGQAGLTMSHMLSKRSRPHLVVERHRIAERWRSERWDGLCLQFPNWFVTLPDFPFPHTDPDAFAPTQDVANFIAAYADFIKAPVRCGVEVTSLKRNEDGSGFLADTASGQIQAANVVLATGWLQRPIIPDLLPAGTDIFQVHAARYRNPDQLPDGAVLVVGAGPSGAQIADELMRAERGVYLSVSRHRRVPRRYRGKDYVWWQTAMGAFETPVERRPPNLLTLVHSGAYGGRTIDFRRFAERGMVLLGRAEAARDGVMTFAPNLAEYLAAGDASYLSYLDTVDAFVALNNVKVPEDPDARIIPAGPPYLDEPIQRMDLRAAGIGAIVWATGYGYDLGWIQCPVLDERGCPRQHLGITDVPGLYFLGLHWQSKASSAFIPGVGDDAARLADHIVVRATT